MNGYTPSIPVREQIKNLYVQVTDDQFLAALARADNGNPYDFVRFLIGEALHPVESAYALEFLTDSEYDDWETDFTGRKFSPKKEAETRAWWNEHYSDEAVQKRLAEYRAAALKETQA